MTEIEINENIEKALSEIRPFLNSDGGDIELVEVLVKLIVPPIPIVCALEVKEAAVGFTHGLMHDWQPNRLERTFAILQSIRSVCP